ncbi:hypothetical protein EKO04_007938 [Ascochyta lentis]|uniref:Uncharacterized protein n=1 Tax=Ascochyta lentis TaxID=205686 RepID=A0A8H7IWS9_9PLEO|nr:hypothetical protein EKO04_007938 [Ascochyta lentis]
MTTPSPAAPPTSLPQKKAEPPSTPTQQPTPLPLPAPAANTPATPLTVDGAGVKLDHLGPLVVNKDGSLSRIANWAGMTEVERGNVVRVLGKRNQLRLGG